MFYYIENEQIIGKSEDKIVSGKEIIEIEADNYEDPIFENGKIIDYINSNKKIINDENILNQEKEELENILNQEKEELEKQGYIVEIVDGKIIKTKSQDLIEKEKNNNLFQIREKTQKIIYEKYSQEKQANMNARIVEINTIAKLEGNRDFTKEEMQDIANAQNMFNWIKEQRQLCAEEIAQLNI